MVDTHQTVVRGGSETTTRMNPPSINNLAAVPIRLCERFCISPLRVESKCSLTTRVVGTFLKPTIPRTIRAFFSPVNRLIEDLRNQDRSIARIEPIGRRIVALSIEECAARPRTMFVN